MHSPALFCCCYHCRFFESRPHGTKTTQKQGIQNEQRDFYFYLTNNQLDKTSYQDLLPYIVFSCEYHSANLSNHSFTHVVTHSYRKILIQTKCTLLLNVGTYRGRGWCVLELFASYLSRDKTFPTLLINIEGGKA